MSEEQFYELCDIIDELPGPTDDYLPTIEVLKAHKVEENLEEYLPYLMWLKEKYEQKNLVDYKEFAKYVNSLTAMAIQ